MVKSGVLWFKVTYSTSTYWQNENALNGYDTAFTKVSFRLLADDPKDAIERSEKAAKAYNKPVNKYPHTGTWTLVSVERDDA